LTSIFIIESHFIVNPNIKLKGKISKSQTRQNGSTSPFLTITN